MLSSFSLKFIFFILCFIFLNWQKIFALSYVCTGASQVAQWLRIHLQCRRPGFDRWIGKIPWRRKWQPTWEVFLHRGSWRATVHRITESWTWLSPHTCVYYILLYLLLRYNYFLHHILPIRFQVLSLCLMKKWKVLGHVQLFESQWTIQSMEFSRPEYWSG